MSNYKNIEEELDSYPYFVIQKSHNDCLSVIKGSTSAVYWRLIGNIYYRKGLYRDDAYTCQ